LVHRRARAAPRSMTFSAATRSPMLSVIGAPTWPAPLRSGKLFQCVSRLQTYRGASGKKRKPLKRRGKLRGAIRVAPVPGRGRNPLYQPVERRNFPPLLRATRLQSSQRLKKSCAAWLFPLRRLNLRDPWSFAEPAAPSSPAGAMRGPARAHRPDRHGARETITARPGTPRARGHPWATAPNRP
jgi:hypothetical protein